MSRPSLNPNREPEPSDMPGSGDAASPGAAGGTVGSIERQERLPARDEVDEVAHGVLRIQIPIMMPGLGHVNCYVLEDDRGATVIDPGLPDPASGAVLRDRLKDIGIPLNKVHTVLVTHSHPDHFGGAGRLKVEHHCEVVAHDDFATPFDPQPVDLELTELEATDGGPVPWPQPDTIDQADLELLDELAQTQGPVNDRLAAVLFGKGPLPEMQAQPTPYGEDGFRAEATELEWMRSWDDMSKAGLLSLRPTRRVSDKQWIRLGNRDWQALHTPGHTGDHLCLWDPDSGVLLSGDHVLPTITPHISGLTPSSDALADFVAALKRVAALDGVTTVLPAHGLPFGDLPRRVDAIIAHHDERLARIEEIAADLGSAGVREFSRELFKERSWGPMAESETYAHLEHLRIGDRMISGTNAEGRLTYSLFPG